MRCNIFVILSCLIIATGCAKTTKLQVASASDATRAVIESLELKVLAEQGFTVSSLLVLGEDVPGFGKAGTQFWQVLRTNLHEAGNIDGVYWVNAESGAVLQVHPRQLQNAHWNNQTEMEAGTIGKYECFSQSRRDRGERREC